MERIYQISERELETAAVGIKRIEKIIDQIFERGMPKDYMDYLSDQLNELDRLNEEIGNILGVWS